MVPERSQLEKNHIFCNSNYMKCPGQGNPERQSRLVVAKAWVKRQMRMATNRHGAFCGEDYDPELDGGD